MTPAPMLGDLPALADEGAVYVVIETAKGSRNKYAFEEKLGVFLLKGVLPEGMSFPFDYGYIPSTKGGDGDPLDILVIMDAPAFTGCVITVNVIGAIEAEQTERNGETVRNDRLIGVATHAHTHDHVTSLSDLRPRMIKEIEAFFQHYNDLAKKAFKPVRRSDAQAAMKLVTESMAAFERR